MIRIDIRKLAQAVIGAAPKPRIARRIGRHIGDAARAEWIRLARSGLGASQRDYIQAIQSPKIEKGGVKVIIVLDDPNSPIANMIEQGWPGGDMRAFLAVAEAPRARRAKAGHFYNIVPFRHGTPGTSGKNVGKPMPRKLYNELRPLARFPAAMRAVVNHKDFVDPAVREIIEEKLAGWHASGQYEGITKTGGGYFTFRVISQKVKRGWIHPGIRARNYARQVQEHIKKVAPALIEGLG